MNFQAKTDMLETYPTPGSTLLQASRRIDWRFLLPDPRLGRVAYLGPRRGTLLEALELFSAALTVIETPLPLDRPPAHYDVVVASGASRDMLREAAALTRLEGFLYIEAYGLLGFGGPKAKAGLRPGVNRSRLLGPADYVAAIRKLGCVHVEAHWHWPDFDACLEIVPLDNLAALRHALARRQSNNAARFKSALGRWLLGTGWFPRVIPCFSIVAQKGPDGDQA